MDRIIEVKVDGNYIRKDKKTAGVRGEYEVAILRIEFDESWDEYKKTITFWDARGLNSVFRELDPTKLENHAQSERVFLVPIPGAPMAVAGEMTFVIDGIAEGKKQRSVSDKLEVKDAPMSGDAEPPVAPTPNDVEQMRLELGRINEGILAAVKARDQIMNMQVDAETLETGKPAYVNSSWNEYHDAVALHFGLPKGDTGDSGVHIGDEAPSDPDVNVWISPDAMASILRIKDENGTWHDITAVRGLSAYEIALQNGFVGSEEEWIKKVEAEARMAEEARGAADVFAGQALQSANDASESADKAEKANLTAGNNAVLAREYKREAQEYALAAGESATSAHDFAVQAENHQNLAREYALASDESATSSHTFAEEAKASADKAEQHANEFSGDIQRIEAGLSLRPTTEQVKAMHEEDMAGTYNIRKIPEGKTIDDLYLEGDYGLYMIDDEVPFVDKGFTSRGSQLIVTGGYYWLEGFGDKTTTCQVLLCHDGFKYVIKQRSLQNGKWSDWEDQFATKDEVSKLTYFKKVPHGKSIDELYGEEHLGWYIGKVKSNFNNEYNPDEDFHFLFVNDGWTITDKGDIAGYFQTRFVWDGFNYKIQTRKGSAGSWTDWEDCFGTDGGGATFFESSTPQIDITLEEEVQALTISELNGKPLSEYNYNTMHIVLENAQLTATGTNSEIVVRLNKQGLTHQNGCSLNVPTTFLNNSVKQYWGGYISLPENLYLSGQTASASEFWRTSIQIPVNTSPAMNYKKIETIYIKSVATEMPIGTKIKIWFK